MLHLYKRYTVLDDIKSKEILEQLYVFGLNVYKLHFIRSNQNIILFSKLTILSQHRYFNNTSTNRTCYNLQKNYKLD